MPSMQQSASFASLRINKRIFHYITEIGRNPNYGNIIFNLKENSENNE